MTEHPTPWRVAYDPLFLPPIGDWHEFSSPHVVDANGKFIMRPKQNVGHPGLRDEVAEALCHRIVAGVNAAEICKTCGDARVIETELHEGLVNCPECRSEA